ncbi:hemicentin-1 isoform X2 [Polyodon spathula]|uniref:hemicentin-1 isoform X2 n=1 Tax=Polyodon spathula TaxID=7913 RepID=UPI001B7E0210|nr:hemicentin-1 isoform X2 [Polyodon spathula]
MGCLWTLWCGLALVFTHCCYPPALALPRLGSDPSPAEGASSLAFVFDVTGSMYDDLQQVVEGASRILEKSLSRRRRPIQNFVLVPFHDPEIGPVSITTDPEHFQRDLRELFVQGGGDCPEMSLGAIKKALEVSFPGSFIYVFTDARAKDYRLKQDVLQLVQLKQSQVVFVLTGDCGDRSQPGYKAYEEIAATSSGQIFHLDKQQVNEVLKWVEETVQSLKVHLVSTDHESGEENEWSVPFDPSLKEVTVSLSGPEPEIELRDPFGRKVGKELGLTELLNIPNSARVVSVKLPRPGTWTLKVRCSGRHTLRVTGVSPLDFRAGFSSHPTRDFAQTRERPVQGVPTHVLLNCTGLSPPGHVSRVELLSASGRSLRALSVLRPSDQGSSGLWNVPEFRSPSESFFLKLNGKDKDGYSFQRLSSVSYTNIIPNPPAVSMPSRIQGYYLQPAVIGCSVESSAPFRLQVTRRGGARLGEEQIFQGSVNTTWEIPRVSGKDAGFYECVASGNAGMGRAQTYLSVSEPPPALELPRNVTAPPGGVAVLSCQAGGSVSYNLTWQRGGEEVGGWTGRVRILRNSSLEIDPVTPRDAGQYHCVASNDQGESRAAVWLLVPEPPRVQVSPQTQTFLRGGEVQVACTATGSPTPQIFWRHGDTFLTYSGRTSVSEHGLLIIKDAAPEHAGSYTCLASNDVGTDMQSATLSYTETPSITVLNRTVLVAAGEEVILECKATGVPPPLVTWYKGDLLVGTLPLVEEDARRGILRIGGVQEKDAGEYSCVASSQAGTSSAMVVLDVGAPPEFSETPADVTAELGQNVTLACSARGYPSPRVTWQRQDGQPLFVKPDSLSNVFQLETGALLIEGLWLDDEGLYVCEAQNQFGLIRTEVRITVTGLEPPLLAEVAPVISTLIGHSLTLPCVLLDGNPPPERHWTHNRQTVSARISLQSDGSLYIDKVSQEDTGIFVCRAVNLAGSASVSITVSIAAAPTISSGPSHYITNEGVAVTLSCDSTGEPKPTTVWSKGREAIPRHSSRYHAGANGSLLIPSPGAEDSGVYVCTTTNPAGYASREMQLSVNTKPRIGGGRNLTEPIRIAAVVGSEVTLPCEVQGSPTPSVTWSRDGYPVPPITARFTVLSSGSLRVSDSRVTDSAEYKCSALNPAGKTSLTYRLHVRVPPRIQPVPRLLKAVIGQKFTLPCKAYGEPAPQISWFRNGAPVGEGGSLIIREVVRSSAGEYRCVALNSAGQEVLEVTLEVLEPPSFADAGDVIVEELAKNRVTLPCPVQGSPTPAVRWFKNGLELSDSQSGLSTREDGSLVIGSAKTSHSGEYKCIATNEAGSAERRSRLSVNVPPEIQEDGQPLNRTASLHQSLTLGCEASGTPSPDITWLKDGQAIPDSSGIWIRNGGGTLRILRVRLEDVGQYSCRAASKAGEAERRFHVRVQAPPVISRTGGTQDLSVTIGQEVEFHCRVSGHPLPLIEWSKDGEVLSSQGDPHVLFSEQGQVMKVKSARLRDQGQYQCLAINAAGRQARDFRLTVHAPPSIRGDGERSEVSAVQGNPTVLSCEAQGMPAPSITWLKEGRPIASNARVSYGDGGRALLLGAVRGDDAGLYTCRASNSAGSSERSYSLRVLVPPQIEGDESGELGLGSREVKVLIHSSLSLSCQSRAFPAPTTQWYKEGQRVQSAPGVHIEDDGRSLRMENARLSDEGRYTCVATNAAGEDRRDFHVSIQVPPVFQRVNGRPAAWELGEQEEEEEGEKGEEEMTDLREVVLSSPVSLSCESNAIPPPRLSWHHDGKELSNTDRVRLLPGGHVLQIPSVRVEDAGRYTCQAVNEAGEDRMHYELVVLVPPVIHDEAGEFVEEVGVVVNSTAQLRCRVSGSPAPAISWLKDGLPLYNSPRHQILEEGMLLQITGVQLADTAAYVCLAENKVGSEERLYSMTVQVPPWIVGLNPDKASVLEGHMVSLMCDVQAYPSPEITWSREGRPLEFSAGMHILPGGQMLQISRARLSDAGWYDCTAINPAGQDQKHIELSVYAPPTLKPRPSPEQDVLNPSAGASITLHCEAEGVPEPEVTWYKNGLQLEPGNGLHTSQHGLEIQEVQVVDSGLYTCKVSNLAGQVDRTFRLTVRVPPAVDEPFQQSLNRTLGTPVTLLCEATGVPPPSITWLKDGAPIESNVEWRGMSGGSQLELGPVQLSHAGTYTCLARNAEGEARRRYTLAVQVPPSIMGSSLATDLSAAASKDVTLECLVRGSPKPEVTWLKDGAPLDLTDPQHLQLSQDGGSLRILDLRPADSGMYSCLAENSAGQETKIYTLTVLVPPSVGSVPAEPAEVTAVQGGSVSLECRATGTPLPQISWLKNGLPLHLSPRTQLLSAGTLLRLSQAQISDSGVYTCVARSRAGAAELSYSLQVQVPPTVEHTEPPEQVTVVSGSSVTFTCEARGVPPPSLSWFKDSQSLSLHRNLISDGHETRLHLSAVSLPDSGLYACIAANQAGRSTKHFNLTVLEPPKISPSGSPQEVSVALHSPLELECTAIGTPPARISWLKDGSRLERDGVLHRQGELLRIQRVQVEDAGLYTCLASSEAGEDGRNHWVQIQVPPNILGSSDSNSITALANGQLTLECQSDTDPSPAIQWFKDDIALQMDARVQSLAGGQFLEIQEVSPSDSGQYSCVATNIAGSSSLVFLVSVHVAPVIKAGSSLVVVNVNQPALLPCEVEGSPSPTVTWRKDGSPISHEHRFEFLSDGSLRIRAVQISDAGRYHCTASNPAGSEDRGIDLVVHVAPSIHAGPVNVTVTASVRASLNCETTGIPRPQITWTKNGVPLNFDLQWSAYRLLSSGSLVITSPTNQDAGQFECTATNEAGEERRVIKVTVQVPPSIVDDSSDVTVTAMSPAVLSCHATGQPEPEVSWTKGGAKLGNRGGSYRVLPTGTLEITAAVPSHAGRYTCFARNVAGMAYKHMTLAVQEPPVVRPMAEAVEVVLHHGIVLPCEVGGFPRPSITWQREGVPVATGSRLTVRPGGALQFSRVTAGDAGVYLCVAQNEAGTALGKTQLIVQEPPVLDGTSHATLTEPQGGTSMLNCAVRGDPVPTLRWHKDGQPLSSAHRLQQLRNGSLAIYNTGSVDAGEYRCVAESEAGVVERTVTLTVQVPGGYSNWMEWGPCSVTCGRGVQERIRLCNNPAPGNGGGPCEGRDRDSRSCQTARCPDAVPLRARGSVIGMINEREFGVAFLDANVTESEEEGSSTVRASIENIPHTVGPLMRLLVTVFAPIYWTTAFQTGTSRNGFSLTQGVFRQESQVEFGTGEVLRLTHVARGLDAEGVLLVDIVMNGFIPKTMAGAQLALQDFNESYTQTGEGQLYGWSSQRLLVDGAPLPLRCNHTVVFEGGRGPLLQLLRVHSFTGRYRHRSQEMSFQFSTSLRTDGSGDRCPGGFVLDSASYCADENECALESPCSHSCHNFMGGFSCACPSGFHLAPDTSTCQDTDECSQGIHMCHYNQQCVNTPGTYRCLVQCGPGFKPNPQGNGCEDLNECEESIVSPCQQRCLNTAGSFHCACEVGYRLAGKRCEDINECTMNMCPAHQQCRNTDGSYKCLDSCPAGMTQAGNGACMDVDECEDGTHTCRYSQVCENTIGGYRCSCPRGYRSQGAGRPCVDIDECQQVPRPCAFQCRNVAGSFRCLCPSGAALLGDGRSCAGLERARISLNATGVLARLRPQLVSSQGGPFFTRVPFQPPDGVAPAQGGRTACPRGYVHRGGSCVDVDECLQRKLCQHDCRNTQGSYQCMCPSGYQLLPNGRNCKDVDECVEQGVTCAPSQMCFNTRGGHQCLDTPCPASYQRGVSPGSCIRSCSLDCSHGGPLSLQYKLLTLPLGIPANHNVIRLSAFSDSGVLQEHTVFRVLEQAGGQLFGIREEGGRGIIYTLRALQRGGLSQLRVQATTHTPEGQVKYQSIFIIYIAISHYPF